MSEPAPSGPVWLYAAFTAFFVVFAVFQLAVPRFFDPIQIPVSLLMAAGSALFVWVRRGGPAWAGWTGQGAYALAVALALAGIVAEVFA